MLPTCYDLSGREPAAVFAWVGRPGRVEIRKSLGHAYGLRDRSGGGVVAKKHAVAETTLRKRRSVAWCGDVGFLSVSNGLRQWLRWPRVTVVGKVGHDVQRSGARWR